MNIGDTFSGALFSEDRRFRFAIWRIWDRLLPLLLFIGLNPSTAAEYRNDPTVFRLVNFAMSWGFGGLLGINMHPYITAHPKELWPHATEQQDINDQTIREMRQMCPTALVGWGNEGRHAGSRPAEVIKLLGEPVYCLAITKLGEPSHPLYLPASSRLIPYLRANKA